MKTIEVPVGGIIIGLGPPDPGTPGSFLGGNIIAGTLKEDYESGDVALDRAFDDMMDALESILLAHACAGIDVTSPVYLEGLETAIDACANQT